MDKLKILKPLLPVLRPLQGMITWLRKISPHAINSRLLTRDLFSDVGLLDLQEIQKAKEKMREFCSIRNYDIAAQAAWDSHIYRMLLTEKWLQEINSSTPGMGSALDLGVESITSDYWRYKFSNIRWQNTDWDLRYQWKTADESVDLILCTELVEHLSDQPNSAFNEGFYKSGFIALLRQSYRVLKSGGYLFITTPNASSVLHILAVLQGLPPWFFVKHVREYTLREVLDELKNAGFEIVRAKDVHCMSVTAYSDFSSVFQILLENGFSTSGRGDDLFVLARKPL